MKQKTKDNCTYKDRPICRLLRKIGNSGEACVEILNYHHKSANICRASLRNAIRRDGLTHLTVVVRNNRVFVINTLLVKGIE